MMEHIRTDQLVAKQLNVDVNTAAALIMEGRIWIGNVPADKPGTPLPADTVITCREKAKKYASRSGYKLEKALAHFAIDPAGLTVCDIGASNGGFTDCLLQNGAARVFAVDVAYGILDYKLRTDHRVTVLERTNARNLTPEQLGDTICDMVTVDVSFISLNKIYPAIHRVLKEGGEVVTLIKPQFEAKQKELGKNGILKDPAATLPPLMADLFACAAENGLTVLGLTVSPIHGQNGNVEYLAHYRHTAPTQEETAAYEGMIQDVLALQPDM
ncbi:MAG: TlyA family RNA methyltransferase [Clostridia bacterium]|nr:TlyA family RNA methyltransferase [Clostridia bacterium]